MFRRRRTLPPELRDALRFAERVTPRRGRWRRHLAMLLPGALVPSMLIIIGYFVLRDHWVQPQAPQRIEMPPAAAPAQTARPAMPRVIYGGSTQAPAGPSATGGTFSIRATVVDGDTVSAGGDRLRLNGIDAPEMAQVCERGGSGYQCGEQARVALGRLLGSGALTCETIGTDRYDRRVVRCVNAEGQDIAAAMVAGGWAMAYRQFSMAYVPQEDEARARGRGIWAGRFEPPWEWRRRQGH
ncbi:thermonuclease family protein [Roseomonas terrae]|uniref:Thermonuclease family protein n=1 Tax=Neoroseomonas terrae TaxID=424799 RepID=A0ABS5EQ48_9PROT|nr:thermonuclease family protein [Neoroseomonas terrae]MBR0653156.1 thermonuclease family protein [Neoroseomonas terrae]